MMILEENNNTRSATCSASGGAAQNSGRIGLLGYWQIQSALHDETLLEETHRLEELLILLLFLAGFVYRHE